MLPEKSRTAKIKDGLANLRQEAETIAKLLIEGIDLNPHYAETLVKEGIPYATICLLESVGRGQLHPALLFDDSPGARAARGLPYSKQKILVEEHVPVVSVVGKSKTATERKKLNQLSPKEVKTVFSGMQVLSPAEQEERLSNVTIRMPQSAYEIRRDGKGVNVPYKFLTWDQIAGLAQMAPKPDLKALQGVMQRNQVKAA